MADSHAKAATSDDPLKKLKRAATSDDLLKKLKRQKKPTRAAPTGEKRSLLKYGEPSPRRNKQDTRDKLRAAVWKAKTALYKYDKIMKDQVRLMLLQPSPDPEAELHAKLVTVSIEDLEEINYEALSYHWGDSIADNPIYLTTKDTTRTMKHMGDVAQLVALRQHVKDNLYEAIRHLRQKNEEIPIWADGLCIDQMDEKEKGEQIPNMALIYSKAARVCVWLGLTDKDRRTDKAMDFITKIVKVYDVKDLICPTQADNWRDLIFLMRSSWFSRRWIIQELALAKEATVLCGSKAVEWQDFSDAVSLFDLNFSEIRKLFSHKAKEYNTITELKPLGAKILVDELSNTFLRSADQSLFAPTRDLESLISTLPNFETADPRDTVYSFLNIARDTSTMFAPENRRDEPAVARPTPNYGKDLLQVYTQFLEYIISTTGSLDIICRQWALPERKKKTLMYERLVTLPSWIKTVPGSSYGKLGEALNGRKNGDSFVGIPDFQSYNASRGISAEVRFGMASTLKDTPQSPATASTPAANSKVLQDPISPTESHHSNKSSSQGSRKVTSRPTTPENVRQSPDNRDPALYVKGFVLSKVTWATEPIPDGIIPQGALKKLGWKFEWEIDDQKELCVVPDQVWRTLVADRGPDGKAPPSWYHRACLRCLVNDTPNGHIATKEILGRSTEGIMHEYLKRVQAVTWNRVVFEATDSTKNGHLSVGLGPPETERDDIVCILFGCSVPCILRPHRSGDQTENGDDKEIAQGDVDYKFIGEAFIYGIMDGQAIESISKEELAAKSQEFRLL
ncbi:heterokaryon incompatibility protein-domain-containing protein [Xylariaceae sp. FL0255]|nr:heterokaryon incompatibility protein-domain-containing protein [Xylariaceae sp. FL0255]